jgi:two-component system nitrate/nitrite response regulator NarL
MRLLLIDDHKMFVDGLVVNLKTLPNIQLVNVQNSARSALDHLEEGHIYHMIMLDLSMPDLDGFQFMDTLADRGFHFPVVILSGSENPKDFMRLREYNISGYISKSSSLEELSSSLQKIIDGETVIPQEYAIYFSSDYEPDEVTKKANKLKLPRRKLEIITCISGGMTNKQIAEKLFVAKSTIDHHVKEIYRKLEVNTRAECINKAKSIGLI